MVASVCPTSRRRGFFGVSALSVLVVLFLSSSVLGEDDQSIAALRQMGKAFASIAGKASPAVVSVKATRVIKASSRDDSSDESMSPFDDELFRYFFGPDARSRRSSPRGRSEQSAPKQVATGSGFLISDDGYILTNNHMVGDAESVLVQLVDGRKFNAKTIGADEQTDVALIKIEATGLPFIELADSGKLEVGEWVIAIGNPFGLSHTVTAGIVSAKGRQVGVARYEDLIQTDAAINFGNSGGPLLNLDGKAVGINAAIIGPGGNVGIGLAIPSNMARDVCAQLKENGKVVRGYLGVSLNDLESGMGEYFGVSNDKGVAITRVFEGSPAEKAGIKVDDIVVELEGEAVTNLNDFRNKVAMHKPGSKIELVVVRDSKRKTIAATLDELPKEDAVAGTGGSKGDFQSKLGLSVQNLTQDMADQLGLDSLTGIIITDVKAGSIASEAELQRGDVILEVNRKAVRSVREFKDAVAKAQKDGKMLLRVRQDDVVRLIILPLSEK